MTYCVAMLLDTGLVFLSDSRTSAGVDQISTFRKTTVFQRPGDRVLVLQTAGNLAITQAVTSVLREHIEANAETTYFQIGESKYGKPIIDRVLRRSSSLNEAAKCALVSMDSTIKSNLSVGLPLDLVIVKRDRFAVARHMSIDADNEYFRGIRTRWSEALREAFAELPDPDWLRTTNL